MSMDDKILKLFIQAIKTFKKKLKLKTQIKE